MISDINRRRARAIIPALLVVTLFSVSGLAMARQPDDPDSPAFSAEKSRDSHADYDRYARFIAGMGASHGELAAFQSKPAWVEYSRYFDRNWKSLNERLFIPEQRWAERELGDAASSKGTVFYPFSGPDFANVFAFFPRARTYVLLALEQLGEIPKFSNMSDGEFKSYFESMKNSLHGLLNMNYFISSDMTAEIEKSEVKGVLPVLLFMLARNDAKVLDVRYWSMGLDGKVEEFPGIGTTARDFPALGTTKLDLNNIQGIRITFNAADALPSERQTLYYFRLDLSNKPFDRNHNFLSFLRGLSPFSTFIKSASYLMFDNAMSSVRRFALEHSRYIVQEDSGVPLKYFEPSRWSLRFYGRYVKPISAFSQDYQEALASIYKTDKKIKPLPFGFGYYYRPGQANLMFGEKRSTDRGRDEAPYSNPDDNKSFLYNSAIFECGHRGS